MKTSQNRKKRLSSEPRRLMPPGENMKRNQKGLRLKLWLKEVFLRKMHCSRRQKRQNSNKSKMISTEKPGKLKN